MIIRKQDSVPLTKGVSNDALCSPNRFIDASIYWVNVKTNETDSDSYTTQQGILFPNNFKHFSKELILQPIISTAFWLKKWEISTDHW